MVSLSIKQTREKERKREKKRRKKSSSYRIVLARPAGLNTFPFGMNVCRPPRPNICSIGGKQSPLRWTPMSSPIGEIGENERNGRSPHTADNVANKTLHFNAKRDRCRHRVCSIDAYGKEKERHRDHRGKKRIYFIYLRPFRTVHRRWE